MLTPWNDQSMLADISTKTIYDGEVIIIVINVDSALSMCQAHRVSHLMFTRSQEL